MLVILLGDYGGGKTTRLVLEAVSWKGKIVGNMSLDLDNYTKIDPIDLKDIGFNCLVLLDELQTWLESRVSPSFRNRYITNIIDESRKRRINIYGTAHVFSSIDLRFRHNTHRIIRCSRIGKRKPDWEEWKDLRDFRYETINTYSGAVERKRLRYERAVPYFELFKTYELIKYPNQQQIELEVVKDNPEKLYYYIKAIAEKIKPNIKKITHPNVEMELLKNGFGLSFERLVYASLISSS